MLKSQIKGKIGFKENVEYVLKNSKGEVKKIFQPNKLYLWLLDKNLVSPDSTSPLFGRLSEKMVIANLITNAGIAGVAARINGSGAPNAFSYIALGTGTTAAAAGDTALVTEITDKGGNRASATVSLVTTNISNDTAQLVHTFTFTSGASFAITESGVLNAASTGTLLARQVFSAINVSEGDSLQVTWKFSVDTA